MSDNRSSLLEASQGPADTESFDSDAVRRAIFDKLFFVRASYPRLATNTDYYMALVHCVRDMVLRRWVSTAAAYTETQVRTVAYLSAEYLMGPHLGNNLLNLGIYDEVRNVIDDMGLDFDALLAEESEPGLGNGGLGRLAACFVDSLATLEIPALAYGIRYEFGIFEQHIVDGWQVERTDKWLRFGNPWEIARPEWAVDIKLGGWTEHYTDELGRRRVRWVPERLVQGVPHDTPILGYRRNTANTLRLWRADAPKSFDFSVFNRGDYYGAVAQKVASENLSKVLYPNDEQEQGKELRLQQQYFFVSCSLQDMLRILETQGIPVDRFHEKFAVQLNDTHPAIGVAELMRLLVDKFFMTWEDAWEITRKTFAYTNHTLLPEALEQWPVDLFRRVLPRHLEIIFEINKRFLDELRVRYIADDSKVNEMSLINESGERYVRMAHLACVGSHAINGVAELHTRLLREQVIPGFAQLWPERLSSKTNGVTPRRWIALANPRLAELMTEALGDGWLRDLDQLRGLEAFAEDAAFRDRWRAVKQANKHDMMTRMRRHSAGLVDPLSVFDVLVKRIHEYKRQHLSILFVIAQYLRMKNGLADDLPPRTVIYGGKAAPGYHFAKLIIKLINSVGEVVNNDPQTRDRLRVVFMPNFNVTIGQQLYPAADLSEQISLAGKEASGTGNMKFQMNGALTIGTMDGANIEIREEVGAQNFFDFGLTSAAVQRRREEGYRPRDFYENDAELAAVIHLIESGLFAHGDASLFKPFVDQLLDYDPYFLLADFRSYCDTQRHVGETYQDTERWVRMSILNSARSGKFSSDRTIAEYCREIWDVQPLSVDLFVDHESLMQ
ncbi:MAG TPA: glycogen/starch/alpha-glucan phosphorylase [Gammaproteobacteria bacterium]|nr:glycogen/starch/alpha-glucan phosphorylase [Gammaproteobacteria bacterium]